MSDDNIIIREDIVGARNISAITITTATIANTIIPVLSDAPYSPQKSCFLQD